MQMSRIFSTFILMLAAPAVLAQTWPDLTDDAGIQGGGENDAALVVGVTNYYNLPQIHGATQNAEAWQQWLLRSRKVRTSNVILLTDKTATRPKIEKALERLTTQVGPQGTLWFVFIGHGAPSRANDDGMLLGVDTDADTDSIDDRGVAKKRVLSLVGQGRHAHSVVVLDASFSGQTGDGSALLVQGLLPNPTNRNSTASTAPNTTILSASETYAGPLPHAGRPALSYLLLGALRGWADKNGDKAVDVDEAYAFVRDSTQALFKASDRLPSKMGPSVVLAKNVRENQPDMAALVTGKCPAGSVWAVRKCVQQPAVECPAGTAWNGSACVSLCPVGSTWNGRACAATTIECPAASAWNGSACVATQLASAPVAQPMGDRTTLDVPDEEKAHYAFAKRLFDEKRYVEAATAFDLFLSRHKGDLVSNAAFWKAESFYQLGVAAPDQGSREKAFKESILSYQIVLDALNSSKADGALFKIGLAYEHLDKEDRARVFYEELIANYKTSPLVGEARKRLWALGPVEETR